jgi:hypothetical protein
MELTFVMPGWEGSAHNGKLWDAAWSKSLQIPEGKCLLGDSGFPLSDTFLVPYWATKYHLKDWDVVGGTKYVNFTVYLFIIIYFLWFHLSSRPQTPQELFNLCHSSAWNVIEWIFGVIKSQSLVVAMGCQYDITLQVKAIIVMAFLHNFIWVTDPTENSVERHGNSEVPLQTSSPIQLNMEHFINPELKRQNWHMQQRSAMKLP